MRGGETFNHPSTEVSRGDLRTLGSPDGPLTYLDTGGNGPAVVLLHGGFVDHRMWHAQIPALARTHRVIAPDARGHGASSVAKAPFRRADDVAALLKHLDTGPAVLVGLSMGGATAVDVALEHPPLVRALVVSGVGTSETEFHDPFVLRSLTEMGRALGAGDTAGWVEAFMRFTSGPHRTLAEVDPEVLRLLRDLASHTIAKHRDSEVSPDHHVVPVTDTWARAARIDVPVLAIVGGLDSDDNHAMADRLVRTVAHGRLVRVEDTAHYPSLERPEVFNAYVSDFLSTL
ncbi:hydrolase [Streptomyces spiroverticillatus]|uniref:Hydrolase n=1 Tax=Streptomyces finlayi TaxID=67296 RepID=A0A918X497_9ACTN|nr:alpha/beta hydrolase [Streptomyces finlayi]GHA32566.1 hydrolase [Streptomyces spiroverticillatus]GHD10490.1 hydrolase [Streptomyces finlayi]